MSGTLPQSPAFSELTVTSVQPSFISRSISGRRQARQTHGQYFKLTAKYPPMTRAEFAPIYSFVMKQRGQYEAFQVIPPVVSTSTAPTQTGGAWEAGQTVDDGNGVAMQIDTSGDGSLAKFQYTTDSSSPPVLTMTGIPSAGQGYRVGDTVTVQDQGSTSNYAILTVATTAPHDGDGGGVWSWVSNTPSTSTIPKINGASQTGRSVVTDGWTASAVTVKGGEYIKFANHDKVYSVINDVTADSGGNATIVIEPALITSPVDNSLITHDAVNFTVALTGRVQEFQTGTTGLYEYELDLEEVI